MNKSTLKHIAALSIVCFTLIMCKGKNNSENAHTTESEKNAARYGSPNQSFENVHQLEVWLNDGLNGCKPYKFVESYDNMTHSVSGNLYFEEDTLKNAFGKNPSTVENCVEANADGRVSIMAFFNVKVPVQYLKSSSIDDPSMNLIVRLFENEIEISNNLPVYYIDINENEEDPNNKLERHLTTETQNSHFKFCDVEGKKVNRNNAVAHYLLKYSFMPDNFNENFGLFFAIGDSHNASSTHLHHIAPKGAKLNKNISGAPINLGIGDNSDLESLSLNDLKELDNSQYHIAEHIKIIPFSVCYNNLELEEQ